MNTIATCPSREDLERLFAGQLPLPQVEQLAGHLEGCQACSRTVETLPSLGAPAGDTLADALRRQSASAAGPLEPDLVHLMERLRRLRAPASGTAETIAPETGVSTPTADASAAPRDVSYDFLAPPQAPDEIGRLGPYRILKVLGQGGMGMVFKAEDPRLDRLCALKTMLPEIARKPEMKERFLREAKAAAKIEHDHIIPIFQVDEAGGVPYIAMPFLKGASLEDYLKQKEKGRGGAALTVPQIIKIGREIARGLAAAHERGMIHRDIKPANVWLDGSANGRVKILDFGLARLSQGTGEQNLTQSGAIMGTPSYMAPEQAQSQKLDGRADLFSLGVILYRMCTGELPFKGNDPISTLMSLAMHNPPPPAQLNPAIPAALSDLVMRLLAKDPAERTESADVLLKELQEVAAAVSAAAGASSATASASITSHVPAIVTDRASDSRMRTSSFAPASLVARLQQARPFLRRPAGIAAIAAGLLAVIALAPVYWIQTPAGVIRVEITDPQVEVAIKGTEMTFTGADPQPVSVRPGEGEKVFTVTRGDFTFETDKLVLKKGDETTIKVELLDGVLQVTANGRSIGSKPLVAPQVAANPPPSTHVWPSDAPPPAIAPFAAAQAKAHQEAWAKHLGVPVEYSNSIGMKFRLIPPGEFLMGSSTDELDAALAFGKEIKDENWNRIVQSEAPQHRVVLTRPFYLGLNEVTQDQFQQLTGRNPAYFSAMGGGKDLVAKVDTRGHPVEMTTWEEVVEFCIQLADRENLRSAYNRGQTLTMTDGPGYRLPTEAEWEFACRAGTMTRFWTGDHAESLLAAGWFSANAAGQTQPVGMLRANPFGLHDMHGNVWEWSQDPWKPDAYTKFQESVAIDPSGALAASSHHAVRGGSYLLSDWICRAAHRDGVAPSQGQYNIGFRILLSVEAVQQSLTPAVQAASARVTPPPLEEWLAGRTALTVAQDGSGQFKTIGEAISKLKPGEYVRVLDRGPYRELLRFAHLPKDTGLVGDRQATIEITDWNHGHFGHTFEFLDGFRLSGFQFVGPPHTIYTHFTNWTRPRGLVIEDCRFALTKPGGMESSGFMCVNVSFDAVYRDDWHATIRWCDFDGGNVALSRGYAAGPVLIEQNYFQQGKVYTAAAGVGEVVVRHNVFLERDIGPSSFAGVTEVRHSLAFANNTVRVTDPASASGGFTFADSVPPERVTVCNNISDLNVLLKGDVAGMLPAILKNWRMDHNAYAHDAGIFPKHPTDLLMEPGYLSTNPADRDFLRIAADSPLAIGGAGGDLPTYLGALPPGPAPEEGDWFTRLRERWCRSLHPLKEEAAAPPPAIAPFDAVQAKAHQEAWAKHLGVPVEYTNSIGMKLHLIPPGEFQMGSTQEEIEAALPIVGVDSTWQECVRGEGPAHRVELTKPFFIGVHEVTQQQYAAVMGMNPASFSATGPAKDAVAGKSTTLYPIETVSWNDAVEFCARLSESEKLSPRYARTGQTVAQLPGNGYRLPTEAEWEFACRAGTSTRFWCGDADEELLQAAWFDQNAAGLTNAVGQLRANPFGLFDVHGNVWEFVQDGWDPSFYRQFADRAAVDPDNPGDAGAAKVVRGGRGKTAASSRSAGRYFQSATNSHAFIGFRVVLPVDAVRPPRKN